MSQLRFLLVCALIAGSVSAQDVADSQGVKVDANGFLVLHRTAVKYPVGARQSGIQGIVTVDVTLDAKGNVSDIQVVSGPMELRRAVLESVLQWHYASDSANATRRLNVEFHAPAASTTAERGSDFLPAVVVSLPAPAGPLGRRVKSIEILGLPADARTDLLRRLPIREGDVLSEELAMKTGQVVRDFDEHLGIGFPATSNGETNIQIISPGYVRNAEPALSPRSTPERIIVSANVARMKLKLSTQPDYPPLALQARIQGVVKLQVVIAKDGSVQNIAVISGHPLLVPAAIGAVKQWAFEPTTVNGNPVEVAAPIDVDFTLPQ